MTDQFEATPTSVTRRSSGAKISLNLDPLDQRQVRYENPALGVDVKFRIRWIYEPRAVARTDKVIEVCLGAILRGGELCAAIGDAVGEGRDAETADLVRDCHELIVAGVRTRALQDHSLDIEPRLYEAADFGPFFSSVKVRPDAVARLQAVQVR